MKRIVVLSLLSCAVLLGACSEPARRTSRYGREASRYGYQGEIITDQAVVEMQPAPEVIEAQPQQPSPSQTETSASVVTTQPKPTPAPVVRREIVTATPVPGKPGFVKSPFAPGLVDVRGFPPGTEVKCPYSNKVFLVP